MIVPRWGQKPFCNYTSSIWRLYIHSSTVGSSLKNLKSEIYGPFNDAKRSARNYNCGLTFGKRPLRSADRAITTRRRVSRLKFSSRTTQTVFTICVPTKFKLQRPGLGNRAVLHRFYSNTTMIDGEFVPFPSVVIILAASTPDGLRKRYAYASAGDDKARTWFPQRVPGDGKGYRLFGAAL